MYNMSFTKDKIEGIIKVCLQKLRKQDKYLLDKDVNERTITHKLAEYLQQHFPEFNVDCEYNRFEHNRIDDLVKRLELPRDKVNWDKVNWDDTEAKTVFPDILVHKRGKQEYNLLVIEVKKKSKLNTGNLDRNNFDINKLRALTEVPYNYKFGLFLRIDLDGENDILEWFP